MQHRPTISIILDDRKALASGLYPIKLRATFQVEGDNGKKKWKLLHFPTGESASRKDFLLLWGEKSGRIKNEDMLKVRLKLKGLEAAAEDIGDRHEFVDVDLFTREYTGQVSRSVSSLFDAVIAECEKLGQVSTGKSYESAKNKIVEFAGGGLMLPMITPTWLKEFVNWMAGKEKSVSTTAIYLRNLRRVFNDAIAKKIISADFYPFGRRKFIIQEEWKPKTALTSAQKDKLLAFKSNDPIIQRGVDFWGLSYYCCGMNVSDLLRLRFSDIKDNWIMFNRGKTRRTARRLVKTQIFLVPAALKIIAKYRQKSLNPSDYIFPVLVEGLSPSQAKHRIQVFIRSLNDDGLKKAAKDESLKFDFKLTTYTARHTWANVSLENGATVKYIQEQLSHGDGKTTENYLHGFNRDVKKKWAEVL